MPERRALEARLTAAWYRAGPPSLGLRLLSRVYAGALALRDAGYAMGLAHVDRLPVPVIVVGNLTVGGTGKTPLTAWLARRLAATGRRPGIASRGYGGSTRSPRLVEADDAPETVGDEPLLLKREAGVPVCVAARRGDAARRLLEAGCDLILCDDGLQHRALARDLELAVIDGVRGLGNGWLLPAGPLREPASRLATVDAEVVNGGAAALRFGAPRTLRLDLVPGDLRALKGGELRGLDWLRGRDVHAVTGIGNPARFFDQLRALGATVHEHAFGDHHRFAAADIRFDDARPVILTSKDAVKCAALADERHWCLPVTARLSADDEHWLVRRILALAPAGRRSPA